ncbi:hypothetical protein THAOC_25279, partial [Thalassiosira oceanica]
MKSFFSSSSSSCTLLSVLALAVQQRANAGCSTGAPEFLPDFAYPQWANDGDKPMAKDLASCTANSAFYLRFEGTSLNDTIYDNSTDAFLLNGGTTQTFTCAQALDPNNKATIDLSEGVPNDDVECCNAFRYRSGIPISAE